MFAEANFKTSFSTWFSRIAPSLDVEVSSIADDTQILEQHCPESPWSLAVSTVTPSLCAPSDKW